MRRIEGVAHGVAGWPSHPDINETSADGFFATPLEPGQRAGHERALLSHQRGARAGKSRDPDEHAVLTVRVESNRVYGVVAERDGKTEVLAAPEVVLCAGAINSAAILLRSGIGPADELQRLGIAPVADRPGVGSNYQNHSLLHFAMTLDESSRLAHGDRHYTITSLRFSSGLEGCRPGDLFLYFVGRVSNRPFGTRMGMIAAALYAPFSRGAVTLQSPDPDVPPRISQRLLSDPRDAQRMVIATRFAEGLIVDQTVRGCFEETYLLPRDPPLRLVNGTGALGAMKALAAAAVLGSPPPLRRAVMGRAIQPGRLVADREQSPAAVRCGNPGGVRHHVPSELHLRDRTRGRPDGGGRSGMPRLRRRRAAGRRRVGDAARAERQHQHPDTDDRRARRRLHPRRAAFEI